MALSEFLSRLFKSRKANREGSIPPSFPSPPISFSNNEAALRIDTVYACVAKYSNVISTLPILIKRRDNNQEDRTTAAYKLLNEQPNEWMDAPSFWAYMIHSILLTGNAYALIENGGPLGRRLVPINPMAVREIKLNNYYKEYYIADSKQPYTDNQVLHFVGETVQADGLKGVSVISKYALQTLEHAKMVETYAYENFRKGTNLSGVIEIPQNLTDESRQQLYQELQQFHQGYQAGGGFLVLDAAKHLNNITIQPDDEKFIRSEQFSVESICRWFDMPLHLVQSGQQASYNSNEQSYTTWKQTGLVPKTCRLEKQLNRKLLGDEFYVEFNYDELLRPSLNDRMNAISKAVGRPIYTPNEWREYEGLPRIEGGDELFIPGNLSNHSGLDNGGGENGGIKTNE
jgi:HK97 family phage portal protein